MAVSCQLSSILPRGAGQHEPSLTMLRRLSEVLGIEFYIDITLNRIALTA
jgi:hypothetical protein